MLSLVTPSVAWFEPWIEAHAEWGPGQHEDGFGLDERDDVESVAGFQAWISRLESLSESNAEGLRSVFRWVVNDRSVVGGIALRYGNDEVTNRIGHVGFGIRPSARGRGIARFALGEMAQLAGSLGIEPVVLVCEADNVASRRAIEAVGGRVVDDGTDDGVIKLHIKKR